MEKTRAEKGQNEMQPHIRVRPILWKRNRFTAFREKKRRKGNVRNGDNAASEFIDKGAVLFDDIDVKDEAIRLGLNERNGDFDGRPDASN